MTSKHFFPLAALQYNLRRLLVVRSIVFVCQILALIYAYLLLKLSLDYLQIAVVLIIFVFINIALILRLKQSWVVSEVEFLAHLLLDVIGLSLLLYLSGGANNPFVSYFLVPVTISAAILPWVYTWIVAGTSLLSYSFLLFFYRPLPELDPMEMNMTGTNFIPSLHIVGMWFNFLVSAALITYFVVKMAEEIRTQERKLTVYREDNLRDEQILAVATQAAGTAHELGTPLSTVAVLLTDMELEYANNQPLQKDIALLKQQISTCKATLQDLVKRADFRHASNAKKINLIDFIKQILDQWQLLRPEVALNLTIPEQQTFACVNVEATLPQAIVNMLNNAADASPAGIEVKVSWDKQIWKISIRDFGEGINPEIIQQLGSKVISTKQSGLGMGIILSQATINRLGGEVRIYQHEEQGTVIDITLPLLDIGNADV